MPNANVEPPPDPAYRKIHQMTVKDYVAKCLDKEVELMLWNREGFPIFNEDFSNLITQLSVRIIPRPGKSTVVVSHDAVGFQKSPDVMIDDCEHLIIFIDVNNTDDSEIGYVTFYNETESIQFNFIAVKKRIKSLKKVSDGPG